MKKTFLGLLLAGVIALPLGMASAYNACDRATDCECNDVYKPVCTTDNKTYANACYARRDGKHVARQGKCFQNYFTPVQTSWHPYSLYNRSFVQGRTYPVQTVSYTTYERPYSTYYVPYSKPYLRTASYYYPRW
ncbi:hypothetical protein HC823_00675 [Candidatus Gracilibacteria bacterium]|nr:hypothetical protein [Candidatus Gracilibacteria bacterium]